MLATDPYLATTFSADCPCAASSRASMSGVRPCGKRLPRRSLLAKSGAGGVSRRAPTWENRPALSASYETSVTVSRARTTSAVSCTARSSPCALPPPRSASATATPSGRFAGANRSTLPPRLHPSVASTGPHTQLRLIGPSLSRARPGCERALASLPHRSPCPERLQEVCVRGLHGARIVRSSEPIAADPGLVVALGGDQEGLRQLRCCGPHFGDDGKALARRGPEVSLVGESHTRERRGVVAPRGIEQPAEGERSDDRAARSHGEHDPVDPPVVRRKGQPNANAVPLNHGDEDRHVVPRVRPRVAKARDLAVAAAVPDGYAHAHPLLLPARQRYPPAVQLTADPVERSGATIAQHYFRVQQAREQTVPQPEDQRNAVAACRRWGDEVDGVVQMGGRRPCQGLRFGPERRAVGQGKEETEVTARGVGDRASRNEVTHGQRGAVWVRECGLLPGVADLQQLEMVDVFRFERLVAHFQPDPAVPVRANPEPVDVTRLEGRAERVGEALRLERPRASAVGVDGRTVPEAIRG